MKLFIPIIILLTGVSCTGGRKTSAYAGECFVVISQSGQVQKISEGTRTIQLERKDFSIRWWDQMYSLTYPQYNCIQIAAGVGENDFANIKPGTLFKDTPCFALGTGMVGERAKPYSEVFVDPEAHHYIYYENDGDRRANVLTESGDVFHLDWPISAIFLNKKTYSISEFPNKTLRVAIFQNHNHNEVIDHNELLILTIEFKD